MKRVAAIPKFMNDETVKVIDHLTTPGNEEYSPYVTVGNNMEVDPGLIDQDVKNHGNELVQYIKELWNGVLITTGNIISNSRQHGLYRRFSLFKYCTC